VGLVARFASALDVSALEKSGCRVWMDSAGAKTVVWGW